MRTTGWLAAGFAVETGHVTRVRSRTASTSIATALRSGPERFAAVTTVACVKSAAAPAAENSRVSAIDLVTIASLIHCPLVRGNSRNPQRFQELLRAQLHQTNLGRHLEEPESLLHVAARKIRRAGGTAEKLS